MAATRQQRSRVLWLGLLLSLSGCAAARPLSGIPAASLPDEFRTPIRSAKRMIDLSLLRQTPPDVHRVDSGDVLGVYVAGFLGGPQQSPPVNFRQNPNSSSSVGYPIRVRADGSISLPGRKPISVRGMTISETEDAVRRLYTTGDRPPIKPGFERVLVTLQRPRHYRILVIRQESGNSANVAGGTARAGINSNNANIKRGTGRTVN
ncbi:MAG: polysaccharide biosynthesis/export family protein, partial [Planctomycetaceae bacterium]